MAPSTYESAPDFRAARGFVTRLAVLIFLVIAALQSVSVYVESLWYGSLGFASVYWYRLRAQSLVFLIVGVIAGALGVAGVASVASQIAWVLFVIGIVLLLVSLITGRRTTV